MARGPLHGDERGLVALVFEVAVVLRRVGEVRAHLVAVGRVADDEPVVLGAAVDDEVVQDEPSLVDSARVHRASVLELLHVVGDQVVHDVSGVLAAHAELAHVADVEDPRRVPHRLVLVDDARVLHGHGPAGERDHPAAERDVLFVEGAVAEGRLGHRGGRVDAPNERVEHAFTAPSGREVAIGVVLDRRAGAHEVAVPCGVVDAPDGRPELARARPRRRGRRPARASTGAPTRSTRWPPAVCGACFSGLSSCGSLPLLDRADLLADARSSRRRSDRARPSARSRSARPSACPRSGSSSSARGSRSPSAAWRRRRPRCPRCA